MGILLFTVGVFLTCCNHVVFFATTENVGIIHTTKSDVQLNHTQITISEICTNTHSGVFQYQIQKSCMFYLYYFTFFTKHGFLLTL